MTFSNKTYDILKFIALKVLPGLATLWLTLGEIWNFPYTAQIGATITAVDAFLGLLIGISTKNYYAQQVPGDGHN